MSNIDFEKERRRDQEFSDRFDAARLMEKLMKSRKKVLELAQVCPLIQHMVTEWRRGECDWEQAMTELVLVLAEQNEKLMRQILDHARLCPASFFKEEA